MIRERPILFSGEMVRAILDGRKTQTRRIVKPEIGGDLIASEIKVGDYYPTIILKDGEEAAGKKSYGAYDIYGTTGRVCPYGKPGDKLWVRETWSPDSKEFYPYSRFVYRATDPEYGVYKEECEQDYKTSKVQHREHQPIDGCPGHQIPD